MEFRVLGQIEAVSDGSSVALGSLKQRSLLALLLIHGNQVVSTDRIIDELWGDQPGEGRQNALWVHMSNLRSALEPDRGKRSEGTLLLTRAPGYLLQVDPDAVDAWRFERMVAEGRGLLEHDPGTASLVLGESLGLWRGRPYADVMYESFAQPEIGRLDELRLEAVELRIDADLRRGLAAELTGELESLARQHPLRERFTELLMLALYRSGRQAEALRAFARLRSHLGEELGLEPSAALRTLEERIVTGDPSLDRRAAPVGAAERLAVRGYELRQPLGEHDSATRYQAYQPAVGREVAIEVIGRDVADDPAFIRRFESEAEALARLEHPNVVPVYDYWREPGAAYLVTGLSPGPTLAEVARHRPLQPDEAARMVRDLGSALAMVHQHGIAHRALTPSSVLIDTEGRVHLGKFGIVGVDAALHAAPEDPSDVHGLATLLAYALTGRDPQTTEAVAAGIPAPLAAVIERATSAASYPDMASFVEAVQAASGSTAAPATAPSIANPYKGLRPFEEVDAADFFGRERLVERLLARLGEPGTRGRFVALVGPSGSGKSSVVGAGLLPALRQGAVDGSADWFLTGFTPGRHPFEELEGALLRIAVNPPASLLDQLSDGEAGIRRAVRRVLPDQRSQLLLVVDQFEELFTQASDEAAHAFLDSLAAAIDDPQSRLRVVITLRADFYDRPLRHRGIGELLRRGTEVITPLSPVEVERAINGPVERVGVGFEPGLVAQIVADVAEHPEALPLLQYALTELYDRKRDHLIDVGSYRDLGGLTAALARRAEILFGGFDAAGQETARQVLLRLVTLGEGSDDVRRRVLRSELVALGGPEVDLVLETFGRHRLLSFDRDPVTRGPTVEIAHEALLSEWDRFRGWIDESRDDLRQQRRLAAEAAEWLEADQNPDYLVGGTRLAQLAEWAALTDLPLDTKEREYLESSVARRDREQSVEDERRREGEQLRLRTRWRTRLLIGSAVALAAVAALGGFALVQRNEANRLARELAADASARNFATASIIAAETDPEKAMLLAFQSLEVSAKAGFPAAVEAEEALHWAIQGARVPYGHSEAPIEVRVGPNGTTGVPRLPLPQLVELAQGHLGTRSFTAEECAQHGIEPCPASGDHDWPALPAEPARPALPAQDDRPLAGTTISLAGLLPPEEWRSELDRFEEDTGIAVQIEDLGGGFDSASAVTAGGVPLDLLGASGRAIQSDAADGRIIDLSSYIDPSEARASFGDYLVDAATVDAGFYGIPFSAGPKATVWHPLREFAEAGYAAPGSWDELIGLSEQIVADGGTPWCLGLHAPGNDGWPASDWVEALVLRLGGVELYDGWLAGEVSFEHPTVRQALAMFGQIAFGEGFVRYGSEAINRTDQFDAKDHLTTDPPGCWMNHTGSWLPDVIRSFGAGGEVGFFVLPPIAPGGEAPLIGEASMIGAYRDRPEIRQFMRWLLDPEWGATWASNSASTFLSPNLGFDVENCRSPALPDEVNEVRVRLCKTQRDALLADQWRLDASDYMPWEVGGWPNERPGSFMQAMLDYIEQGPDSVDRVLAGIDETWP